jgi:N-methylhydantoinase A
MKRIGIDVGGTFTDVILVDDKSDELSAVKVPTTPDDPVIGAINGIRKILELSQVAAGDIGFIGHGTTIATNLIVEGKGAPVSLVTTQGFRDILEIRRVSRHDRADLYDLFFDNPPDLVPRSRRHEVAERIRYDGAIEKPLEWEDIETVARQVADDGVEAVAICLINSHICPDHERALLDGLVEKLPNVFVTASIDVNPEMHEYERSSTTVINAMLGPRCGGYIRSFEQNTAEEGIDAEILFMRSNGGLATPAATADKPVSLLESGPAGGVTAAAKLCQRMGIPNAITGDMGGTTFDVSLIRECRPEIRTFGLLKSHAVRAPTIDIESIGAGGGSVAWIDAGGGVHIGPESAGAVPGPACYGRGGNCATVTDCNLVLGYVDPDSFMGGDFALDVDAAHRVVEKDIAKPLNQTVVEAARIVRAVANAQMAQAIRLMTVERGYDPRDFAYICFGGGGPLHAIDLAEELDIPIVIVPNIPGLFSAFGMLVADQIYDLQAPVLRNLDRLDHQELSTRLAGLRTRLDENLKQAGVPQDSVEVSCQVECRYIGQAESLTIELPSMEIDANTPAELIQRFEVQHQRQWNFIQADRPINLINMRIRATVTNRGISAGSSERADGRIPETDGARSIVLERQPETVPTYKRENLLPGQRLHGPGIIEEQSSCLVFRAGRKVSVDGEGNLIVTRED